MTAKQFLYTSARQFALTVLGTENTADADHYATWLLQQTRDYEHDSFVTEHERDIKRWAAQGHGPDWLHYFDYTHKTTPTT